MCPFYPENRSRIAPNRTQAMSAIIVITGASRGIGAATARLAAAREYAVCVNYRANRDAAEDLVRAIEAAGGPANATATRLGTQRMASRGPGAAVSVSGLRERNNNRGASAAR